MSKILVLFKAQLLNNLGLAALKSRKDNPERKKTARMTVLYSFVFLYIILMFAGYIFSIGGVLSGIGRAEALVPLALTVSFAAVFFMTLLRAPDSFFACRDFDLLMSMPVSSRAVFASKLLYLYAEMLLYTMVFTIPCAVCCGIFVAPAWWFYPLYLLLMLFAPALAVVAATAVSFLLTRITLNARFKNLLMLLLSIGLLCGIMFFNFRFAGSMSTEGGMVQAANAVADMAYKHPLANMLCAAVLDGSIVDALLFLLINVGALALVAVVIGSAFLTLNTRLNSRRRVGKFTGRQGKAQTVFGALFKKEAKSYFSQYMFVMNTAVGGILLLLLAVLLLIKGPSLFGDLFGGASGEDMRDYVFLILTNIIIFTCGLTMITASSISLEGNTLWILQTAPVTPKQIYAAKVLFCIAVGVVPAVPAVIIISVALELRLIQAVLLVLLAVTATIYTAVIGLGVNLRHPKFNWTSPVTVYKQGTAVLLNMLYVFAPCIIGTVFASFVPIDRTLMCALLCAVLWVVITVQLVWLSKKGIRRFIELSEM